MGRLTYGRSLFEMLDLLFFERMNKMINIILNLLWILLLISGLSAIYFLARMFFPHYRSKRRLMKSVVILFFAMGTLYIGYLPRPILVHAMDTSISKVEYQTIEQKEFNGDQIIEVLSKHQCRPTIKQYFPYFSQDYTVQIQAGDKEHSYEILLGDKRDIFYVIEKEATYEIIDDDSDLYQKVLLACKQTNE